MSNLFKTLIVLFFFIPLLSIAQKSYAPLGATWNYQRVSLECVGHVQYVVENERMIDGKDCSVIYSYYKA